MTQTTPVRTPAPTAVDVPFHRASIDEDDIAAVVAVLRSGWLTTGPQARAFENAFAAELGGGVTALAVNSCTSAMHLALEAAGVGAGHLVLTTPYTFTATAEVIRYLGADPVFADVDPRTGNLTERSVRRAYEQLPRADRGRVRALLPVHFAGLPCDLTALSALASAHGWHLVDDAAHALPASHAGLPVGRWGSATAFSFYATKTLCTGEGGMVVSSDEELLRRMRVMRLHGIDRDAFDRYATHDAWRYSVVAPGFKYNLPDLAAALGVTQLRRVRELRAKRAALAESYDALVAGIAGLTAPARPAGPDEHAWHLYALQVDDGPAVRDQLVRELAAVGIGTSVHFIPLHLQPYYRDAYRLCPQDLPGATGLFRRELSLPLFPDMTGEQLQHVATSLPPALQRARQAVRR